MKLLRLQEPKSFKHIASPVIEIVLLHEWELFLRKSITLFSVVVTLP